jgi:hypothetical protein
LAAKLAGARAGGTTDDDDDDHHHRQQGDVSSGFSGARPSGALGGCGGLGDPAEEWGPNLTDQGATARLYATAQPTPASVQASPPFPGSGGGGGGWAGGGGGGGGWAGGGGGGGGWDSHFDPFGGSGGPRGGSGTLPPPFVRSSSLSLSDDDPSHGELAPAVTPHHAPAHAGGANPWADNGHASGCGNGDDDGHGDGHGDGGGDEGGHDDGHDDGHGEGGDEGGDEGAAEACGWSDDTVAAAVTLANFLCRNERFEDAIDTARSPTPPRFPFRFFSSHLFFSFFLFSFFF